MSGSGLPVDGEIATAVLAAAKDFEARGAILVPMLPVMTRAMLDGLEAWRGPVREWPKPPLIAAAAPL